VPTFTLYVADVVAISVLVFVFFLPRHRKPELVVAILTANVGVLAVSAALSTSTIGAGLGLGLFGILSIIRLRSQELTQSEVAYYFAALTLGLLGGLDQAPSWVDLALMAAVLTAIGLGDASWVRGRVATSQVVVDRAFTDPADAAAYLTTVHGLSVATVKIVRTDLVNDTTAVELRHVPATTDLPPADLRDPAAPADRAFALR
jgi:hypothetical protein